MDTYEKKYNEAQKWIESIYSELSHEQQMEAEAFFPELKESEDEKIRKEILHFIKKRDRSGCDYDYDQWLAWLENQGEQESADKHEPKFHKGEWIIHQGTENIYQVVACIDNQYQLRYGDYYTIQKCADVDRCARLWDITKDAKDGDVLAINWNNGDDSWEKIIIFKKYHNKGVEGLINAPCVEGYGNTFINGEVTLNEEVPYYSKTWTCNLHPATKSQRDILFAKMKEVGYEWNSEKKELKKISQRIVSAEVKEALYDKPTDEEMKELLRTEYEKGRADTIAEMEKEWSEEDEKRLKSCLNILQPKTLLGNVETINTNWLKSLKDRCCPQKHWKPTEEMLEALYRIIPQDVMEKSEDEILLDKLYQGLKYGRILSK